MELYTIKMMNADSVAELVKAKMQDTKIILASSTEPYKHFEKDSEILCKFAAGGLVAALDPVMQACGGVWVAAGSGDADRAMVDENDCVKIPEDTQKYTLHRVWHDKEEADKYYDGFSNQVMWPMCHALHVKPNFDSDFWRVYRRVNKTYSDICLEEADGNADVLFFLQDYHLSLVAKLIREKKPDAKCVLFWHIPWPNPDVIKRCPWKNELLEGLLANDILGFHIDEYTNYFLNTAEQILGANVDYNEKTVEYNGHVTRVKAYPISIDFESINGVANSERVRAEIDKLAEKYPYEYMGVGVERVDYTKGLPEKLRAIERFLEKYPEYENKFVYIQYAAPSRIKMKEYMELNEEINSLVERINSKHPDWKPFRYIFEKVPFEELIACYAKADFCSVTPLKDGMNLVTKEFVASQKDETGVLILSEFIGAAVELGQDSILVNPHDIERSADAMKKALDMPMEERRRRMRAMREQVKECNVFKWVGSILDDAAGIE